MSGLRYTRFALIGVGSFIHHRLVRVPGRLMYNRLQRSLQLRRFEDGSPTSGEFPVREDLLGKREVALDSLIRGHA